MFQVTAVDDLAALSELEDRRRARPAGDAAILWMTLRSYKSVGEALSKFGPLRSDDHHAVRLGGVALKILPMIVTGWPEFLEGDDLGHNRVVKDPLLRQLDDDGSSGRLLGLILGEDR